MASSDACHEGTFSANNETIPETKYECKYMEERLCIFWQYTWNRGVWVICGVVRIHG